MFDDTEGCGLTFQIFAAEHGMITHDMMKRYEECMGNR